MKGNVHLQLILKVQKVKTVKFAIQSKLGLHCILNNSVARR